MPMPAEYHEGHSNHSVGVYQDSSDMTANMYRVGDYVYFETSSTSPYQIRRIEELNKTANGNVEAKVMCFFRRRDLPSTLIMLADKHQLATAAEQQRSDSPLSSSSSQHSKTPLSPENGPKDMFAPKVPIKGPGPKGAVQPWLKASAGAIGAAPLPPAPVSSAESAAAAAHLHDSIHLVHGMEEGTGPANATGTGGGGGGAGGNGSSTAVQISGAEAKLGPGIGGVSDLTPKQRHQMKHRELFLSRQVETMPATHIRGKCCVTLLNETESLLSYLNKDDSFFYCLVFDPAQRTLLADKGEIRVGGRYQADSIPQVLSTPAERETDPRRLSDLETLTWTPEHQLTDRQIDQFLVISRSVGTFARALDCSSSIKQPSLHMSAAAASRDITLFHAMDTLHRHSYDVAQAMSSLVPGSGPVLCRDEMEEWSASEANLFEEALEKYGKDFGDIRADFLPWKTLKNIIEYYYMWKTTDRYVQQKRVKAVEAESKLKQVYIPNYNKSASSTIGTPIGHVGQASIIPIGNVNNNVSSNGKTTISVLNGSSNGNLSVDAAMLMASANGKPCESCQSTQSSQWYPWGSSRICHNCQIYWKKYAGFQSPSKLEEVDAERKRSGGVSDEEGKGGKELKPYRCTIPTCDKDFKLKAHLARHLVSVHGIDIRNTGLGGLPGGVVGGLGGGGSPRPVMKTRSAFYLRTSPLTRAARRLCASQIHSRHAARAPHQPINSAPMRHLSASPQLTSKSPAELRLLGRATRPRVRPHVSDIAIEVATRLGSRPQPSQPGDWDWLKLTLPSQRAQPDRVFFPRPPTAPDGSLLYERVPNKPELERIPIASPVQPALQTPQNTLKRSRPYDDQIINGTDGISINANLQPPSKRAHTTLPTALHTNAHVAGSVVGSPATALTGNVGQLVAPLNGRPGHSHGGIPMSRSNARKQVMSWMDAPDDVYFRSTESIKRFRKTLSSVELRRAARKPWRRLNVPQRPGSSRNDEMVVILD